MTSHERVYCVEPHTYGPGGRDEFVRWAAAKEATHEQHQCPDCGLWVIWRPRASAAAAEPEQLGLM